MSTALTKPTTKVARLSKAEVVAFRQSIAQLSAKKRMDAILDRKDALKIVRALPALDLYATMRDVGLDDALELLELCSPQQVQAFLDLDGWRGDRMDSTALTTWLTALFQANPDRAVGQLRGLDLELLTLLIKVHARIYDLAAEEEPGDDVGLHSITPDRHYLIAYGGVADDENMQQVLKEALDRMMGRDVMFVIRLCEAVRWELPSALEEQALHWRTGRMADLGFLPRHEALEVFAPVDPDGVLDSMRPAPGVVLPAHDAVATDLSTSVVLPWDVLSDGKRTLAQALSRVTPDVKERVLHELMLCANRVHCAEGGDIGDPASVTTTVRRVADMVATALAYRAKGDVAQLPAVLTRTPVASLFRVACALLAQLQRELRRAMQAKDAGLAGDDLLRLDTPLREFAAGLLRPRPLLFAGLLDPARSDYRAPSSLLELAAAAKAVSEIAFRGALFSARVFGVPTHQAAPALATDDAAAPSAHATLLGTLVSHALIGAVSQLGTAAAFTPLTPSALDAVRAALGDDAACEGAVAAVVQFAQQRAPLPGAATVADVHTRMRAYAVQVLSALKQQVRGVNDATVDARFVSVVLTSLDGFDDE